MSFLCPDEVLASSLSPTFFDLINVQEKVAKTSSFLSKRCVWRTCIHGIALFLAAESEHWCMILAAIFCDPWLRAKA